MSKNQPPAPVPTPLARVLDQSQTIQDDVAQSAAELYVISVVLKQEIPGHVQTGEVAQALQKTGELESRIQTSADDLAQVNEALKQEISVRSELEHQLALAKDQLAS